HEHEVGIAAVGHVGGFVGDVHTGREGTEQQFQIAAVGVFAGNTGGEATGERVEVGLKRHVGSMAKNVPVGKNRGKTPHYPNFLYTPTDTDGEASALLPAKAPATSAL